MENQTTASPNPAPVAPPTSLPSLFNKRAPIYSAVLLIYLVIITLLRWQLEWRMFLFWLGGFLGLILYNLDHLVYLFWEAPEASTTIRLKGLLAQRRFKEAFALLNQTTRERTRLVGHSVIFQAVVVVLAFFALSSTAVLLGKGLVMGMFLYSLTNQALLLTEGKDLSSWFWQLGLKLDRRGQAFYFLTLILVFVYLNRLLI